VSHSGFHAGKGREVPLNVGYTFFSPFGFWVFPSSLYFTLKGKENWGSRESKKLEISLAPSLDCFIGFSSFFCQQRPAEPALTEAATSSLFLACSRRAMH